jgi:tetratricopeptide (TPR) repeat protein
LGIAAEPPFRATGSSPSSKPEYRPTSASSAPAGAASPWIYSPWLDWLVGCGGWSAPLLAATFLFAPGNSHGWGVAFYVLAVIFNYPHFMATVYRAYHSRAQFEKYKIFTLHVTLLVLLTGVVMHASPRLFPWIFTLYVFWSPWHYTGQNFGLMMMFVRREGAEIRPMERRWLRGAFIASFAMLLASFNTGASNDPLVLSLGFLPKFMVPLEAALAVGFAVCITLGFHRLVREKGARAMAAPLTLAGTQFLWFVLPTLIELRSGLEIPQTRYSSGILAVLHSTQYLWITSYYQRREARAEGKTNWSVVGYFVTLIAGGIALFMPGPWLVSLLFHYDFSTSFLIFLSLVNIHHFILDGALWKLRDKRVSSMLVDRSAQAAAQPEIAAATGAAPRGKLAFRVAIIALLFLWGGFEELHYAMRNKDGDLASLQRAASLNPYDSGTQQRIARTESRAGQADAALASYQKAVAINPSNVALQESYARALIDAGRYDQAYANYQNFLDRFPNNPDALVNYGLLAAKFQHPEAALDAWNKALAIDPTQVNAHLYLAQAYDQTSQPASAARHWKAYLDSSTAAASGDATQKQAIVGTIALGDDEAQLNQTADAMKRFELAREMAEQANQPKLQSLALMHLADAQEKSHNLAGALASYQNALKLDSTAGDAYAEGLDWFNYGQFLRRRNVEDDLVYACLVRAESLMSAKPGAEFDTVQAIRRQFAAKLGKQATAAAEQNAQSLQQRATALTSTSL